jgi:hypothetical protein
VDRSVSGHILRHADAANSTRMYESLHAGGKNAVSEKA